MSMKCWKLFCANLVFFVQILCFSNGYTFTASLNSSVFFPHKIRTKSDNIRIISVCFAGTKIKRGEWISNEQNDFVKWCVTLKSCDFKLIMIIIAAQTPFNYIKLCGFSKIPLQNARCVCECTIYYILLNIVYLEIIYDVWCNVPKK